tara:strand:- start:100 stop:672 length:573 start_codon:yes stop_codon:yes gene_type:complete
MKERIEDKLLITKNNLFDFKKWINNCGFRQFSNRKINSIYFDNKGFDAYLNSIEGVTPRKKIRLRYYNNDNKIFNFEIKSTTATTRFKSVTNKIKINKILKFGYYDNLYGMCKKKTKVSYERCYFTNEKFRITIDTNIVYTKKNFKINDKNIIVELKTEPKYKQDIIDSFPFLRQRFSKYGNSIKLLYGL